jgi:hydrogenase maturation factor
MSMRADQSGCDLDGRCITCSDAADPMRVESIAADGLAVCIDEQGRRSDVMLALVPNVERGAVVLVHAGVAIQIAESAMRVGESAQ